tara:strand:- start:1797 stop:1907 length:111 start_codon:yes stop_codon:yes gene_type:complete
MNTEDKLISRIVTEEYVFEQWIIDRIISVKPENQKV